MKKPWILKEPNLIPTNKMIRIFLFWLFNIVFITLYPVLALCINFPYGYLCWILNGSFMILFNIKSFHIHVERYPLNEYLEYKFNPLKDIIKHNDTNYYIYLSKISKNKYSILLEDKELLFDMKGCLFPITIIKAYLIRQYSIPYINKYKLYTDYMGKNINISKLFKNVSNVYLIYNKKSISIIKSSKTKMNLFEKSINGYGYIFWYVKYHGINRYYTKISEKDFVERKR